MLGEKVSPWRGAVIGRGTAMTGCRVASLAALAAPLVEDLLGIEPEVERVVAQEALRVDGAGQLLVIAALEGAQVAGPDLRVALGPVQVHALALAGGVQALGQAGRRVGRQAAPGFGAIGADRPLQLLPRRHSSSPSSPSSAPPDGAASSRRRTCRAFEPSNAPMYPRASSWSIIRAARA